jgi:hypothetical protein
MSVRRMTAPNPWLRDTAKPGDAVTSCAVAGCPAFKGLISEIPDHRAFAVVIKGDGTRWVRQWDELRAGHD